MSMGRKAIVDPEHMDRFECFVVRKQVIAITHREQDTDNPPGRVPELHRRGGHHPGGTHR